MMIKHITQAKAKVKREIQNFIEYIYNKIKICIYL